MTKLIAISDDLWPLGNCVGQRNIETTRLACIAAAARLALAGQLAPQTEPAAFRAIDILVDRLVAHRDRIGLVQTQTARMVQR